MFPGFAPDLLCLPAVQRIQSGSSQMNSVLHHDKAKCLWKAMGRVPGKCSLCPGIANFEAADKDIGPCCQILRFMYLRGEGWLMRYIPYTSHVT